MASAMEICCGLCGKLVKPSYLFKHHQRYHTEKVKKFPCHPCSKEFFEKGRFENHMKTMHDELRMEVVYCDSCEKSFASDERMQEHKSYQHVVAPISFSCLKCGKTFHNERVYRKHLQKLHQDLPCYSCGKTLGSASSLKHHKKTKHPDEE